MANNLEKIGGVDTTSQDLSATEKVGQVAEKTSRGIEKLGNSLKNLAHSIELASDLTSSFDGLASTISKVTSIKTNSLDAFTKRIDKLYSSLRQFSGFKSDAGALLKSLSSLPKIVGATKKYLVDENNYKDLKLGFTNLKSALEVFEGLNLKVGNTIKSLKTIEDVATIMNNLNEPLDSLNTNGFTTLKTQIISLVDSLQPLEGVKSKLGSTLAQINKLPTMINVIDASMSNDSGFVKLKANMEALSSAFSSLGKINRGSLSSLIKNLTYAFGENGTLVKFMGDLDLSKFLENMIMIRNGFTQISNLPKTNLSSLSNSLNKFIEAVKSSKGISFEDITRLTTLVKTLSEQLIPLQTFDSKNIGKLVSNIARIPKVIGSISNLGEKDLNNFTNNVNRLSDALIPLENRLSKISLGFKSFPTNLVKTASGLEKVYKSSKKVSFSVNTLLNRFLTGGGIFYFARKLASVITESISISNDFVETLNIVGVSFGKFTKQATETVDKWSEFLGVDPGEALEKWSELNLLIKGFGDGSEEWINSSYTMSQNLTKLAYDLSSLYNIDVEEALDSVQSSISGMSKPMRKFGIDISEAALKEFALSKGIEKSVENMTQMEKAQLRYGIMLEKTKDVQGDLQKTLSSPANVLRIFDSYLTRLKRAIGDLFTPLIVEYVPYILGAMSSIIEFLSSITQSIDSAFGYDRPEASDYIKSIADEASTATEDVDELDESVGNLLSGIDKFNVLNKGSSGQGGTIFSSLLGGLENYNFFDESKKAFEEYKNTFDKVFSPMATIIKDLITIFGDLNRVITPIENALESLTGIKVDLWLASIGTVLTAIVIPSLANYLIHIGLMIKKLYISIAAQVEQRLELLKTFVAQQLVTKGWQSILLSMGLVIGAVAFLIAGFSIFIALADKMGAWEKVITIVSSLAAAIATLAISMAVFKVSLTNGLAAAGIVAGVTLAVGSIISATTPIKFANGGFNPAGNLMFTNENGAPEWVGRQGNSSAVVNDSQMTDVMYESVRNGVTDALILNGNTNQEQELTINIKGADDNSLARALAKPLMEEFRRQGYKLVRL